MSTLVSTPTFSLSKCYNTKWSNLLDRIVVGLLVTMLLLAPLPFGSVGQLSIFAIEIAAAGCSLLWLAKLFFTGNDRSLSQFRSEHLERKAEARRTPFFHKRFLLGQILRVLTFGQWPKKNPSFGILHEEIKPPSVHPYFSVFGYPVRNTGLEKISLAFFVILLIQLVFLPGFIIRILSPHTYALYQSAARAAGVSISSFALSLNAFATFSKLIQYLAYFMIYVVTVNVVRTRTFYLAIIFAIVASATFQAVYGLYELFIGGQHIFGYKKQYFLNCASGTFINRNHYAVYIGLSLPLLMGLVGGGFLKIQHLKGNIALRLLRLVDANKGKLVAPFYFISVIAAGLAFSLSITGVAPVMIGCIAIVHLYARVKGNHSYYWALILAALLLTGGWLFSDQVQHRIQSIPTEIQTERSRFLAWEDTARMFLDFPVFGTGSGTFSDVFPVYRRFGTDTLYSETHNEYLQQLSENGIVLIVLFGAFLHKIVSRLRRTMKGPPSRLMMLQIGAFCSLVAFGLHNLIDFSFQIPAIAVTAVIIAGLFFGDYRAENKVNGAA